MTQDIATVATIAILDDNPQVRESLDFALRVQGFGVCAFASGEQLVDALCDGALAPDALLLDLVLPGMSGVMVQERLRALGCNFPVIVLTAHPDAAEAQQAKAAGAVALLAKPVRFEEVHRALSGAMAAARP